MPLPFKPGPFRDVIQSRGGANVGDVLRSLLFYPAFYGGTVLLLLALATVGPFSTAALRWLIHRWAAWHRFCVKHILRIRVVVEGPVPDGKVLIAFKHESFFEAIDLPHLFNLPGVFAKAELMSIPLWGNAGRRYGLVGVERDQGAKALRAMVSAARKLSGEGRPLVIFPEGTRVPHGQRPAMQAGFAGLYKMLGLPVVPVAVNSGPLYHRRWKRRGTITIRFGEVIPPGLPRDVVEQSVHAAINAINVAAEETPD
jgi:1-acyl-sn-glycerol-3-phosphate acyltransferase